MKPALTPQRTAEEVTSAETDEALMERFCDGDARAFDALFQRYARPVHGFLSRLVKSPEHAEDLTQATFLSLVRARGRFQKGAPFRPWLYAIAANAAKDHLRRQRPEELTPEGELPQRAAEEPPASEAGMQKRVQTALEQLPQTQREAIVLHRFHGLSFGEIAQALGVTESAVKVRAHRGYERLRELLGDLKSEDR